MANVVRMNNYKNVIIPDYMLFDNGKPRSNDEIGSAISTIYKAGGFGKKWGFSIMLNHGDGNIEKLNIEQSPNIKDPMDIVMAYFSLKIKYPEDTENMHLCIIGKIKSKKDLKMPKEAKMIGRCKE